MSAVKREIWRDLSRMEYARMSLLDMDVGFLSNSLKTCPSLRAFG